MASLGQHWHARFFAVKWQSSGLGIFFVSLFVCFCERIKLYAPASVMTTISLALMVLEIQI